jgi:putative heme transporter
VTTAAAGKSVRRRIVERTIVLLVACVSLYLLMPSLVATFSSWPALRGIDPLWLGLAVAFEAMSSVSYWALQRIAFRTRSWFAVATSQLASGTAGRVVPGGGATASAVQFGILVRSGISSATAASGVAASWAATTATALALPAVALAAAVGGTAVPRGLRNVAYLGGGAFLVLGAGAFAAFRWDKPLIWVGRGIRWAAGLVHRGDRLQDLPERLLAQRDSLRHTFSEHPVLATLSAFGKWGFDYLALLCVMAALDIKPQPALVLLAYSASALLGMIPLTPGGLGFVEAGLTGLLVLTGISAGDAAAATLGYRLVSYWLPLPAGVVAWILARRRYGAGGPVAVPSESITTSSS